MAKKRKNNLISQKIITYLQHPYRYNISTWIRDAVVRDRDETLALRDRDETETSGNVSL